MKFIFIFLISISIFSEKIKFIFSGNLNGNLYSCPCGLTYSVGLTKRFTYLKENNLKDAILIDAGNSNSEIFENNKMSAIYESFSKMNYSSVSLGANDFSSEFNFNPFQNFLISSNILKKSFFSKKNFTNEIIILNKNNFKIGILSYFSENEIYKLNPKNSSKLEFKKLDFISEIISKNKADFCIILTNSDVEESFLIAEKFPDSLVYSTSLIKPNNDSFTEKNSKKVFHSGDKNGDKLTLIEFETSTKKITSSKLLSMDFSKLKDDEEILEILKKNEVKIPK